MSAAPGGALAAASGGANAVGATAGTAPPNKAARSGTQL
jgi:hypothetical protein